MAGAEPGAAGPVHVSMNDYLIHRARDVPRVGLQGLRLRAAWPRTPGALGLWVASSLGGRRQVSVSIWLSPEHLRDFVRSPAHLKIMRDFRGAGLLHTTAWTAERLDRAEIWLAARDRLSGLLPGVAHH
jgi:hypothetical protein